MKNLCCSTMVSGWYQYLLPLYVYVIVTRHRAPVVAFVAGRMEPVIEAAFSIIREINDRADFCVIELPENRHELPATTACRRFLIPSQNFNSYDGVIFTDADLLPFFKHISFVDYIRSMHSFTKDCFWGYHGAYKYPLRPEINGAAWKGNFERISGGHFMVDKRWFITTEVARKHFRISVDTGKWGSFREADEVMLARIHKMSNLPIPGSKHFPSECRGIHLGDFRNNMKHRWTNMQKMAAKANEFSLSNYVAAYECDGTFKRLMDIACNCGDVQDMIGNLHQHLKARGLW